MEEGTSQPPTLAFRVHRAQQMRRKGAHGAVTQSGPPCRVGALGVMRATCGWGWDLDFASILIRNLTDGVEAGGLYRRKTQFSRRHQGETT